MISEQDLIAPALLELASAPNGRMATTDLRCRLKQKLCLSHEDRKPLSGRNDEAIDQKIRNLKSHRRNPGNPIFEGLISNVPNGFEITQKGRTYIAKKY